MTKKIKILFLCTGNSCRSQMAEGWARHLKINCIEPYSAGIEIHGINPTAVRVMAEAGVDISSQRSKHVDELKDVAFDYVITVCDHAHESCPLFSGGTKIIHVGFDDPPRLAKQTKTEQDAINCYRRVRDQIKTFVQTLPETLDKNKGKPMKKIQILGPGCLKCKQLTQSAEQAAKELGIEYQMEKVTQINDIMKFGVMITPALVVDGQVKSVGKVLTPAEIKPFLQ